MLAELKKEFAALTPLAIIETDYKVKGYHLDVEVSPDQVVQAAKLMDTQGCFLESITGVDWLGKTPVGNEEAKDTEAEADKEGEDAADSENADEETAGDKLEVVYDYNYTGGELCRVVVRCRLERDNPEIPTISEVVPGANWHERETHDFFGIKFKGHPDLSPLLLPEDADFHPLLKDFEA